MRYRGYSATVEFDGKNFFGTIENIADLVTFESDTAEGLEHEFHSAVEDYLEFRKSLDKNSVAIAAAV